ncbi:hypothetical protein J6590_034065 [Homalodisca vitripennis]|nr:hypothetical protein J6590_034065 [Homalodisca vitripennis]
MPLAIGAGFGGAIPNFWRKKETIPRDSTKNQTQITTAGTKELGSDGRRPGLTRRHLRGAAKGPPPTTHCYPTLLTSLQLQGMLPVLQYPALALFNYRDVLTRLCSSLSSVLHSLVSVYAIAVEYTKLSQRNEQDVGIIIPTAGPNCIEAIIGVRRGDTARDWGCRPRSRVSPRACVGNTNCYHIFTTSFTDVSRTHSWPKIHVEIPSLRLPHWANQPPGLGLELDKLETPGYAGGQGGGGRISTNTQQRRLSLTWYSALRTADTEDDSGIS